MLTKTQCKKVSKWVKIMYTHPHFDHVSRSQDPKGCMVYNMGVYWNKHPIGSIQSGRKNICKKGDFYIDEYVFCLSSIK